MNAPESEVFELLRSWEAGEPRALAELMPLVCDDLCRLARSLLRREAEGHMLEPGALVSEVYLRLHALRSACDVSLSTVERRWGEARLWLLQARCRG